MKNAKPKILAYIPARGGSKRIIDKNIKKFCGLPLIAYVIKKGLENKKIDKVIVDTDSIKIAKIAKKYGAWVPFLRPSYLAGDKSKVADNILYTLNKLKTEENYIPNYLMLLQTTTPLVEQSDINKCLELIQQENIDSVVSVCQTEPLFFNIKPRGILQLVNKQSFKSSNSQEMPKGYILNGGVYIIKTELFLKEKKFLTNKTWASIMPRWKSIDIDEPQDWALAETIYKNRKIIEQRIKSLN